VSEARPPKGFRDLLPEDFYAREYLKRIISATYEQFGFVPIDTPVMENTEVLLGKGGGENEKLMFKILKRGRKLTKAIAAEKWDELSDMGLRYDLTVPLARFVAANRNELPPVFKRYQISPVWRADRPQFGRYREFVQCDVDVIGTESMAAEADAICATTTCLARIGFKDMTLHLNARPLVSMLVRKMGVPDAAVEPTLTALDKIDRLGIDGAIDEAGAAGAPGDACGKIKKFYEDVEKLDSAARLDLVDSTCGGDAAGHTASLREIIDICPPLEETSILVDPFLVRGMDYYTGPIFEIRLPGASFSIAGGGRYDELVGSLSGGGSFPATGFSIGFERILVLMKENDMLPEGTGGLDAVICPDGGGGEKEMMALAGKLRDGGLKVDVSLAGLSVGKTMQEAERRKAKYGVIVTPGSPESVAVRDISTRETHDVNTGELLSWMKKNLGKD